MAADAKTAMERFIETYAGDDVIHIVCCDEDVALCGTDVKDELWVDWNDPTTCIACNYLVQFPCWRCGE